MSNTDIRPTTVVGIKRLARTLKSEGNISHAEALNEAARRAGYENFRHATNSRPPGDRLERAPSRPRLYLSGFWRDRETGTRGRETTWVDVSVPWAKLVSRQQMLAHRSLVRLTPEAEDHLSYQYVFSSSSEARRALCAATRTFQFMDATKLRPTRAHSRVYPGGDASNAIPGRDHVSSWYDPATKGYVFVDEPYQPAAEARAAERSAWATKHGYDVVQPTWAGMYNPGVVGDTGGSRLFLIASKRKGPPLAPLAAALDRLPAPMLEETWQGESADGMERFKSPAELRGGSAALIVKPARATAAQAPEPSRPGRMSIEQHEEIGRKLKAVMADTFQRDGVYKRVDRIRSELDDWLQREYDAEALPTERFREVYYGSGPTSLFAKSLPAQRIAEHVKTLNEVKAEVTLHYANSQAKSLLRRIDAAIKSLRTWTSGE